MTYNDVANSFTIIQSDVALQNQNALDSVYLVEIQTLNANGSV